MFTTTNVTAAIVRPNFSIMNTSNNHTLVASPATNPSRILTSPSVVSIINGNLPGVTTPTNGNILYIATQPPTTTTNIILQSPQTVRFVSPSLTFIDNSNTTLHGQVPTFSSSNNNQFKPGICIDTPILGRLAPITIQRQQISSLINESHNNQMEEQISSSPSLIGNDADMIDNQQDPEIELFVNNVVCSFSLGCKLNLRKIAMEAANVIYKRENAMVLMKMRNPYCSANVWSSGKVTVTGTTSEDDAQRAARRVARCLQRLGFRIKLRNYRVVNCLATCSMPWPIDIVKLSRMYPDYVSYEPEIHPGATVRLNNKAVLKVFTTGSVTLTAPSVDVVNTAVNEFYPQLFECQRKRRNDGQR